MLNRSLKEIQTPIVVFYHTIGGMSVAASYILIEALVTGEGTRLSIYTARQYFFVFTASIFDSIALTAQTVAFQADSSGFVSLLSNLNIVYAYLCDLFWFDESLKILELIAALGIFGVAISVALYKLQV